MKKLLCVFFSLLFVFSFSSCGGELVSYRPIADVNNLDGRRVGSVVGWETDYILSPRTDLTLRRYDSVGDMVMALCYKQLDAVAADEESMKLIIAAVNGVEVVEPSIDKIGYTLLSNIDKKEFIDEFDQWFEEFSKTEDYKIYEERNHTFDGKTFNNIEIEEPKNPTREVSVGYTCIYYPCAFTDSKGIARGTDIEILRYFGRDKGIKINFIEASESAIGEYLSSGKIECYTGGVTDVYREEYESTGMFVMSVSYRYSYIYLIQVVDWDNLKMKSVIEA